MNPENNFQNESSQNTPKEAGDGIISNPNIRTYKDDIKDVVKTQKVTTSKILLAEQKREQAKRILEKDSIKNPINQIILFVSIALILIGAFAIFYVSSMEKRPAEQPVMDTPTFFEVESIEFVETFQKTPATIISNLINTIYSSSPRGYIRAIVPIETKEVIVEEKLVEQKRDISSAEFLVILSARTPSKLIRSLGREFLLGSFDTFGREEPFLLFKVNDFQSAYSGMLDWEKTVALDLKALFKNLSLASDSLDKEIINRRTSSDEPIPTSETFFGTTTNTVGQMNIEKIFGQKAFSDRRISNRDTRVIVDAQGRIRLIYTFIDPEHLLIAQDLTVVDEVISRLRSANLIQ